MRSQKPASKLAGRKAAASCRTPKLRTPIYTLEGAKLVARTPVFGVRGFSPDSRFPISRLPHVFHICAIGETRAADPKCGGPRYEFSASTSQPPWMGAFPLTLTFQFHDCRTFSTFALLARQSRGPLMRGPRYEFSASTSQPPSIGAFPPTLAFQFHDCRTFSTFALLARQKPRTPNSGVRATNLVLRHRSLHGMRTFPPTLAFQFHDCRTFSTFALLARQEPRTPKTGVRATNLVLRHRSLHGWELFPRLSLSNFTTAARFPHLRYWRDKSRGPQMRGSALRV